MHLSKSAAKLWTNYAAYLRSSYKNHIYLCDLLDSRNFGPKPLLACEKLFLFLGLPLSRSLSFNIAHLVAAYP